MKHFVLLATLMIAMCIAHSLLAQQKGYRIVAIDEAPGRTMDAALFSTADPEAVRKYMPAGGAPASVTTFALFAGEDVILFDAGLGNEPWVKGLTDLGVKPENVKLVLLTHFHGDHIGGLFQGDARRFPNAMVRCSELELGPLPGRFIAGSTAGKIAGAYKYGEDFTTFKFDDIVFENSEVRVKALDASGHTPGHAVFLIETKGEQAEKLLIIGDLLHAAALQFPVPEACARFDMDQEKAIAARKRILDFAAQEKIPVAGMHLPPPSIGTVKKNDQGGYDWEPNK